VIKAGRFGSTHVPISPSYARDKPYNYKENMGRFTNVLSLYGH